MGIWGLGQFVSCLVVSPKSQQRTWQIPAQSLLGIVRGRKCLLGGADLHSSQRWEGVDLHVGNAKELSKTHQIHDVQANTAGQRVALQWCERGKFFISAEHKNLSLLCLSFSLL